MHIVKRALQSISEGSLSSLIYNEFQTAICPRGSLVNKLPFSTRVQSLEDCIHYIMPNTLLLIQASCGENIKSFDFSSYPKRDSKQCRWKWQSSGGVGASKLLCPCNNIETEMSSKEQIRPPSSMGMSGILSFCYQHKSNCRNKPSYLHVCFWSHQNGRSNFNHKSTQTIKFALHFGYKVFSLVEWWKDLTKRTGQEIDH